VEFVVVVHQGYTTETWQEAILSLRRAELDGDA